MLALQCSESYFSALSLTFICWASYVLFLTRGFPLGTLSLSEVVLWLLEQCGRPQTECRHKCMKLFYEFVPLLPGDLANHYEYKAMSLTENTFENRVFHLSVSP